MREIWKKLTSIKLAIVLITVIALGSLLATLIPQGEANDAYFKLYPKIVAELVTQTGLTRFFSSILFLIPALLFFLNLGACTADRLVRQFRRKSGRRHGPDILHIGLLVLIVGGAVSFSGRAEGSVRLSEGESVQLPGGEVLSLVRFTFDRYQDGRPREWTSVVNLVKDGKPVRTGVEIKVNKPLKVGGLALYQASYISTVDVTVTDAAGKVTRLARGGTFKDKGFSIFFMTVEAASIPGGEDLALLSVKGSGKDGVVRAGAAGVQLGAYRAAAASRLSTGLQAVSDPGYPLVLAAFILIGLGTALTFFQKLKDVES